MIPTMEKERPTVEQTLSRLDHLHTVTRRYTSDRQKRVQVARRTGGEARTALRKTLRNLDSRQSAHNLEMDEAIITKSTGTPTTRTTRRKIKKLHQRADLFAMSNYERLLASIASGKTKPEAVKKLNRTSDQLIGTRVYDIDAVIERVAEREVKTKWNNIPLDRQAEYSFFPERYLIYEATNNVIDSSTSNNEENTMTREVYLMQSINRSRQTIEQRRKGS
jgi:hypothetical protein